MSEINKEIQTSVTIKDVGSIDKNLKSYSDYVKAGKQVVKSITCHQVRLAYYAIQVCTIRHGGISNNCYTITDYARDIGMNKKTLQEWTLVYRRVIVHLQKNIEEITQKDWKVASRITWIQDQGNRADNKEKCTPRKMVASKPPAKTPEQVRKQFAEEYGEKTFATESHDWQRTIMRIKNLIQKRDLSLADRRVLTELMTDCDSISDHINDYLTKTKRNFQ